MSEKAKGEEGKMHPIGPLINEQMKKIWNLVKHRISDEKLWQIAHTNIKDPLGGWALDELIRRKEKI